MKSILETQLSRLDGLLEELGQATEAQCELLREHLESARVYLVGSMPTEYALSVQMAGEALSCVNDPGLRTRIQAFLQEQYDASTERRIDTEKG